MLTDAGALDSVDDEPVHAARKAAKPAIVVPWRNSLRLIARCASRSSLFTVSSTLLETGSCQMGYDASAIAAGLGSRTTNVWSGSQVRVTCSPGAQSSAFVARSTFCS